MKKDTPEILKILKEALEFGLFYGLRRLRGDQTAFAI